MFVLLNDLVVNIYYLVFFLIEDDVLMGVEGFIGILVFIIKVKIKLVVIVGFNNNYINRCFF